MLAAWIWKQETVVLKGEAEMDALRADVAEGEVQACLERSSHVACSAGAEFGTMCGPIAGLLRELAGVVASLEDEQYVRVQPPSFPSAAGSHVRHVLDHVAAFVLAAEGRVGELSYDHRKRGTDVESSRSRALEEVDRLCAALLSIPDEAGRGSVQVCLMTTSDGPPVRTVSTLAREAAFVVSHTVHHHALLGALLGQLGVVLPPKFGYAPSTIAHEAGR